MPCVSSLVVPRPLCVVRVVFCEVEPDRGELVLLLPELLWFVSEVVVWLTTTPAEMAQQAPPTPAAAAHRHTLLVHIDRIMSPLAATKVLDCAEQSPLNVAPPCGVHTSCLKAHAAARSM